MGLGNLLLRARPLVGKEKRLVNQIEELLPYKDAKDVSRYKKQFKIEFSETKLGVTIAMNPAMPQIIAKDASLREFAEETNQRIRQAVMQRLFQDFAKEAFEMLPTCLLYTSPSPRDS